MNRLFLAVNGNPHSVGLCQKHSLVEGLLGRQPARTVETLVLLQIEVYGADSRLMSAARHQEGRRLEHTVQGEFLLRLRKLANPYEHLHGAARACNHRSRDGHGKIGVFVKRGFLQEFRLLSAVRFRVLRIHQKKLPALAQPVQLILLVVFHAVDGTNGMNRFLAITQTQSRALTAERIKSLDGRKLAHHRVFHHDLASKSVNCSAGLNHDGEIVEAVDAQAADDSCSEHD